MPSLLSLTSILTLFLTLLTLTSASTDFWTVNCGTLSTQLSDPIISPGLPSSHVHAISGGTAFNRTMDGVNAAVVGKATTCDKFTDRSNYWAPQLYNKMANGMYQIVPYQGANMYYKRLTCHYSATEKYCPTNRIGSYRAFPPGLRMIAGDPSRRTNDMSLQSNQAILYETGGAGEVYGFPKNLQGSLSMHVRFPSCWDGVNVDSPDHKSHMAYPNPLKGDTTGGMCPSTHPVALLHIGAEFGFDTASLSLTSSSSLVLSNGDTTGFGGHGDFLQGWTDLKALEQSFDNCDGIGTACAWNSFGTPDGKMGTKSNLKPESGEPGDNIGAKGAIASLPGSGAVIGGGSVVTSSSLVVSVVSSTSVSVAGASKTAVVSSAATKEGVVASEVPSTMETSTISSTRITSTTQLTTTVKATSVPTTMLTATKSHGHHHSSLGGNIKQGFTTTTSTIRVVQSSMPDHHDHDEDDDGDACGM